MNCIDLREICKEKRYRYRYDPSLKAGHMSTKNPEAKWYVEIPCKYGFIYPYGQVHLAVYLKEGHMKIAKKIHETGAKLITGKKKTEYLFKFPIELLEKISEITKVSKRNNLSEEHRRRLAKNMAKVRSKRKKKGSTGP